MSGLGARLAGFAGLPLISLITPLLVLPVLGRVAGDRGWASLMAGEAIGTLAAIVVAYGWNTSGPPRVALTADVAARARLYRESLVVRVWLAVAVAPVVVLLSVLVATPGYRSASALMGIAGTVTGLSFAWYAVGAGDPRSIAVFEAVPRVVAAAVSAGAVLVTRELAIYPVLAVGASLAGVVLFSRRVLAADPTVPADRPRLRRLLVRDRAIAFNDIAGGAYASVPVPTVQTVSAPAPAAAFASADKLYKFGLYVPITLANAFQSWTVEGPAHDRARRLRVALGAHVGVGLVGWAVLAALGPWASATLFGDEVTAARSACVWLGAAFVLVSARISMTRHVLVPAGRIRVVVVSTVAGALVGLVAIVSLTVALGPVGAAMGLTASEAVAAGILVLPSARRVGDLASAPPERSTAFGDPGEGR